MKLEDKHLGEKMSLTGMKGYIIPMTIKDGIACGTRVFPDGEEEHATRWLCDNDWYFYNSNSKGLSLIEAMESGKRFRFLGGVDKEGHAVQWLQLNEIGSIVNEYGSNLIVDKEVLVTRYELETSAEITAEFIDACYQRWSTRTFNPPKTFVEYLKYDLNL